MKEPNRSKDVAQLQVIGKVKYTMLVVNQLSSYIIKLCLISDDQNNLYLMLKQWGNPKKYWNTSIINSIVNFFTRLDKVKELIKLINKNKEVKEIVQTIYYQNTFPFIYNMRKTTNLNIDYPDLSYNIDNFKNSSKVIVEFQIMSFNFKASKKVNAFKAFSFQLLRIYLINKPVQAMLSILEK